MKKKTFTAPIIAFAILTLFSCKKSRTTTDQQTQPAAKKGALLFWINNAAMLNSCGVLTVKLSTGQQTNITGYYFSAPANCVNLFGGYIYLTEGSYTYQVISSYGCTINGGTVTVVGDQCNMAKIQ